VPLRTAAVGKDGANLFGGLKLLTGPGAPPIPNQIRAALQERHARVIDLFRQIDVDGSGHISAAEFVGALEDFGLRAGLETASAVFASLDGDGSGSIEYRELEKMLNRSFTEKPQLAPLPIKSHNALVLRTGQVKRQDHNLFRGFLLESAADAPSIPTQIRAALHDRHVRVIDLFRQIDDDGSGTIDAAEFVKAMSEFGLKDVPANHLSAVFQALDVDGSGGIEVREFERSLRRSMAAQASVAPLTTAQHNAAMLKAKPGARAAAASCKVSTSTDSKQASSKPKSPPKAPPNSPPKAPPKPAAKKSSPLQRFSR